MARFGPRPKEKQILHEPVSPAVEANPLKELQDTRALLIEIRERQSQVLGQIAYYNGIQEDLQRKLSVAKAQGKHEYANAYQQALDENTSNLGEFEREAANIKETYPTLREEIRHIDEVLQMEQARGTSKKDRGNVPRDMQRDAEAVPVAGVRLVENRQDSGISEAEIEKSRIAGQVAFKPRKSKPVKRPKDPFTVRRDGDTRIPREYRNMLAQKARSSPQILIEIGSLSQTDEFKQGDLRSADKVEDLYQALLKKVPKGVREALGDDAIRTEFSAFVDNYRSFREEIKETRVEVPATKEGQEALFIQCVQNAISHPEKPIKGDDPLAILLQSKFRESAAIAEMPLYPRGSGKAAAAERTGIPAAMENAMGWVETSAVSAGAMSAAKEGIDRLTPVLEALHMQIAPSTDFIHMAALAGAILLCYGSNIPLKNENLAEVAKTGKWSSAIIDTVKKNKIKSALLAATVLAFIAPTVDKAIEGGLTAKDISERVSVKLTPAEEALKTSGNEYPRFMRTLRLQIEALFKAEDKPELIPELKTQFPDMTFGESGKGGQGAKFHGKRSLYLGEVYADDIPPADRAIIDHARLEAGLRLGQSLPDALQEDYDSFLTDTEARRTRITELVAEIHRLNDEVSQENIGTIGFNTTIIGKDSTSPREIIKPREELAELFTEQSGAYEAMRLEAERKITVLTTASEDLLPGSKLSIELPEFSLKDRFQDFLNMDLTMEHPLIRDLAKNFAALFNGGELEGLSGKERETKIADISHRYHGTSEALVRSIGISFSFSATFLILGVRAFGSKRRAALLNQLKEFHLDEARRAEEEQVDDTYGFVNDELRRFFPSYPEVTRHRVRAALREFIFNKLPELGESEETGKKFQHWFVSNFLHRGQNSEDMEALGAVKKILLKLQNDNASVVELIDTLMPGYRSMTETLGHDLALLHHVGHGNDVPEEDIKRLKGRFQSKESFAQTVNEERIATTYNALQRERDDLQLEYTCLETIHEQIRRGSDLYGVFGEAVAPSEDGARENLDVVNNKDYSFTLSDSGEIIWKDISEEDQTMMRRVAEETEASRILVQMMKTVKIGLEGNAQKVQELEQTMVTRQIEKNPKRPPTIPASVLRGEVRSIRDTVDIGTGMFEDVAAMVRDRLKDIPRGGQKHAEGVKVSDQIDAMVSTLLNQPQFHEFNDSLNHLRLKKEKLRTDVKVVYDIKMAAAASDASVQVPGYSLRLRVLDAKNEVVAYEDFQMSHVLLETRDPNASAKSFAMNVDQGGRRRDWAFFSMGRLEGKLRRDWLEKRYAHGDEDRKTVGIFKVSGNEERDVARINEFYKKYPLRWKQARVARELIKSSNRITESDLDIFGKKEFTDDGLPPKQEILRVVKAYYERSTAKNFLDGFRATIVRNQGLTIDIPNWFITQSSENRKGNTVDLIAYR